MHCIVLLTVYCIVFLIALHSILDYIVLLCNAYYAYSIQHTIVCIAYILNALHSTHFRSIFLLIDNFILSIYDIHTHHFLLFSSSPILLHLRLNKRNKWPKSRSRDNHEIKLWYRFNNCKVGQVGSIYIKRRFPYIQQETTNTTGFPFIIHSKSFTYCSFLCIKNTVYSFFFVHKFVYI